MMQLECFQGELAKRALKWPKYFSNIAAVVTLGLPSVRYAVLVQKLSLLLKLIDENADGVGARVFHCLDLLDDVSSICLLRECREVEEHFGSNVIDSILHRSETSIRAVNIRLKKIDYEIMLRKCTEKEQSIAIIERDVGSTKLWNAALDMGAKHTRGLQAFSRVLSHHGSGVKACPLCDVPGPVDCLLEHLLKEHHWALKLGDDLLKIESLLSRLLQSLEICFTNTIHVSLLLYAIFCALLLVISMKP